MTNWKQRWEQEMIGWHNLDVNQNLKEHVAVLEEQLSHPRILMPLCGKSVDISWLATRSQEVVGVEFVTKAIEDFYKEQGVVPTKTTTQGLPQYTHGNTTLIQSNIFDVSPQTIGLFDSIYDRAALVALSLEKRQRYADLCLKLLKPKGRILLITYDSPTAETDGPPYPVKDGVIPLLYQRASSCEQLRESIQYKAEDPRLQKRNLAWSRTCIWKITK